MFPPGHYGMALALYSVVGYALLVRGYGRDALAGGGVVLSYALLPDLDGDVGFLVHRGVTHTVWFALAVGTLCVLVVSSSLRRRPRREALVGGLWAFFLGAFAVAAHLLADALNPWGVMPVYPVSSAIYSLDLVRAPNDAANYAMLTGGVGLAAAAWVAGRRAAARRRGARQSRRSLAVRLYRRLKTRLRGQEQESTVE
jgi:inner membrane protein